MVSMHKFGMSACDKRPLNSCHDSHLSPDELQRNWIGSKPTGGFHCALCWANPLDQSQVLSHLQSRQHARKMFNVQYQADPLGCVPSPHRHFTVIQDGWPICRICNKRMEATHWNSERHRRYLKYYLGHQDAPCNVGQDSSLLSHTLSPLSQSAPLSERFDVGCGIPAGGVVTVTESRSVVASSAGITSGSSTLCGAHGDNMSVVGDVYVRGVVCEPVPLVSVSVKESAPRRDLQHPWGSRGRLGDVLNDDEWSQILQEFDARYAGDWWPIDMEWKFFDV